MERSHVDINKLKNIPEGGQFEYRDVVQEDFPDDLRSDDGALFNKEVEVGLYKDIKVTNEDSTRVTYKKIKY